MVQRAQARPTVRRDNFAVGIHNNHLNCPFSIIAGCGHAPVAPHHGAPPHPPPPPHPPTPAPRHTAPRHPHATEPPPYPTLPYPTLPYPPLRIPTPTHAPVGPGAPRPGRPPRPPLSPRWRFFGTLDMDFATLEPSNPCPDPYPTPTLPYPTLPYPHPTLPYPTLTPPYPTLPYPHPCEPWLTNSGCSTEPYLTEMVACSLPPAVPCPARRMEPSRQQVRICAPHTPFRTLGALPHGSRNV
jgi:hypothetical protein